MTNSYNIVKRSQKKVNLSDKKSKISVKKTKKI